MPAEGAGGTKGAVAEGAPPMAPREPPVGTAGRTGAVGAGAGGIPAAGPGPAGAGSVPMRIVPVAPLFFSPRFRGGHSIPTGTPNRATPSGFLSAHAYQDLR